MNPHDVLQHHGVKGMRWGVRKMYENHKENLRYKYRKKGLSEEDVEKKLKRRLAAEKIGLKNENKIRNIIESIVRNHDNEF